MDARATVELLRGIRSIVDVSVHVWEPRSRRWRPLSLEERKVVWQASRAAERRRGEDAVDAAG